MFLFGPIQYFLLFLLFIEILRFIKCDQLSQSPEELFRFLFLIILFDDTTEPLTKNKQAKNKAMTKAQVERLFCSN